MSKKTTITIALVLAVGAIALAFAIQSPLTDSIEHKAKAQTSEPEIPKHILYEQVFRMTVAFKIKAEADEQAGEEVSAFATYFKDKAQLTEQENEILKQVSSDFIKEVSSIDEEAEALIILLRKNTTADFIEPPPELIALQEERVSVVLLYRSQLRSSLGTERFVQFDNFVYGEFASGMQIIPVREKLRSDDQGGK